MKRVQKTRRGFTLIEILIVGALLALFAGIAIINISEMYNNNLRKATIGEAKNLATACAMAQQDLGFIPKFNYLTQPKQLITTDDSQIRGDFDYQGFINYLGAESSVLPSTLSITDQFNARGYFAMTQSRGGLNRGRGGVVKVRLASGASGGGQNSVEDSLVDWPADPWGNPYVLYQLKTNKGGEGPAWRFIEKFNEPADYMIAVVSYGPNGVPGTVWEKRRADSAYGQGVGRNLPWARTDELRRARLFVDGDQVVPNGRARFTMPRPESYFWDGDNDSVAGLRTWIVKGPDPASADLGVWGTIFPTEGLEQSGGGLEIRGILDAGSDDIVYVF